MKRNFLIAYAVLLATLPIAIWGLLLLMPNYHWHRAGIVILLAITFMGWFSSAIVTYFLVLNKD